MALERSQGFPLLIKRDAPARRIDPPTAGSRATPVRDISPLLRERQRAALRDRIAAMPTLQRLEALGDLGKVAEVEIEGRHYEVLIGMQGFRNLLGIELKGKPLTPTTDFSVNKDGQVMEPRSGSVVETFAGEINRVKKWGLAVPTAQQSQAIAEQLGTDLFLAGVHEFWTSEGTTCTIPLTKVLAPLGRLLHDGRIIRNYGPQTVVGQLPSSLAIRAYDIPTFGLPVYGANPLTGIVLIRPKA